ncbi:fibronectin type III domain-containing protein [Psychroflexus planctonicus]|uniref:Por secretion system C-terminal sorting domain-containing protein n=1 Tax=Psychroflexus planctonicus TaxID=1526575 RepID=A0ABQ1SFJ6_9FLAO|nr:DUF4397 domain-containing protein [Psychroflexus planctonicus]GGE30540.1 hypothetical protein GCM10010832_08750 [Psychroflexus planctonicus]
MKFKLLSLKFTLLSLLIFSVSWGQYSGTGEFNKINSTAELEDGYYVIANETDEFAMNNAHTGSLFPETAISPSGDQLTDVSVADVWLIENDGTGWTIYNEADDIYASYSGSSNNIQAVATVAGDNERWTMAYDDTESYFTATNAAVTDRVLRYNTGSPRFVCYASSFGDNLQLYKLASASTPTAPETSAPVPTEDAANVVSIYSDAYTNVSIEDFDPFWGQPVDPQVNTTFDPTGDGTNFALEYVDFTYQGTQFDSDNNNALDLSDMDYFHVDIWVPDGTDRQVRVSPINFGTGAGEVQVEVPLTPGSWNSVTLDKTDFTNMTWDAVNQLIFNGQFNGDGSANTTPFNIYLDNIYFSQEPASTGCDYVFDLTDTWGDGWNGNAMEVYLDGVLSTTVGASFTDGASAQETITVDDAAQIEVFWVDGSFESEVGFTITNGNGDEIFNLPSGSGSLSDTTIYTSAVDCDNCTAPYNPSSSGVSPTEEEVSWLTSASEDAGYEWTVVLSGDPISNAVASGDATTGTLTANVTGLQAETDYDIYISSVCGSDVGNPVLYSFTTLDSCLAPENLSVSNITDTTADLSWDLSVNASDGYDYVLITDGSTPDNSTTPTGSVGSGVDTESLTGLTEATDYEAFIRSNCGGGSLSEWSSALSFTTECATFTSLSENFDNSGTDLPNCWSQSSSDGEWQVDDSPTFGSTYTDNTTGSGSFAFVDASTFNGAADDITLTSPFVDVSGLTTPALEFYVHHYKSQGDADNSITVEFWDGTAWNQVYFDDQANVDGWQQVLIDLGSFTITGDVQVRFIVDNTPDNFYNEIAIDDVSFIEAPSCFAPTSLETSNVAGTSLDFSWDGSSSSVNGYEWAIIDDSGDISDDTTWIDNGSTDVNTTNDTSALLSPETDYVLYVRTDCDTDGLSDWASISFTTTVLCPTPSDLATNGIDDTSVNLEWTAAISETAGYEYVLMPDGLDPVDDFGDNVANGTTAAGETTLSLSSLSSETSYDFYLRAVCDAGEFSEYISVSFTTACSAATLNYEEDFTGFTTNINTSSPCWAEGTGIFDNVTFGGWGGQNFNNDAANPNGTALYINLYSSSTSSDWAASQTIDLGAGSADNILSYDAFVKPWSGDETVTDMGNHSVQVVISEDGGLTWDLATNSVATYDNNNIPNDLSNTEEEISLAGYSGVIQVGFYAEQDGTTPDLRFYIDNVFVGVPPTCDAPLGLDVSNITLDGAELSWDAVVNPATEDAYTWYVFAEGDDPAVDTPVDSGVTDDTSVTVTGLMAETNYEFYVDADCGADGESELSDAFSFFTGYCSPVHTSTFDYVASLETLGAVQNVSIAQTEQGPNSGYQDLTSETIEAFVDSSFDVEIEYSFDNFGAKAWVDWNNDLEFAEDEVIFTDENDADTATSVFTVPSDVTPGDYRVRFRAYWQNNIDPGSCESITYGDAFDYTLTVSDQPDPVFANVQIIHNSPDPAAASVDVYLDGQLLPALTGVDFRTASEFLLAPAGVDFVVDVVPAGADLSESVHTETFNLMEDENYIIVANGVLDTDAFISDNAFELSVYAGAQTVAADPTQVDVLVHHGSPDAPAVDVNETDAGNLVSNIAYPEFDGYLNLAVADYTIEIAAAGDPAALFSYEAPLATLGGFEGAAITVVASGFFGDDADTDNGFGLWVATAAGGPLLELPETNISTIDFDSANFTYYPNPVKTSLTIEAQNNVEQVEVFNVLGQRVITQRPNQTNPRLDMNTLESGVYLMKVSINGANKTFQIIKD